MPHCFSSIGEVEGVVKVSEKPSVNFKQMKILNLPAVIIFTVLLSSCNFSQISQHNKIKGDTIRLNMGIPLYDPINRFIVQLDSVRNDSRCPKGVTCVWEGNAAVQIRFNNLQQDKQRVFALNTQESLQNDTVIDNYFFKLLELHPYPEDQKIIANAEYWAKVVVKEM